MPDNLPARFFTPRVTFRVTLRAALRAVAALLGFARFARDFAADDLPRDLAAADLPRANLAVVGFARDLAAAGFARRDAALGRRVATAPALRTAAALRAGRVAFPVAFLAVTRRFDFLFATGIWSSHLNIDDNMMKRRIGD